ncbi:hypothetical protein [Enterobacter sp.]|uniref:hypothetical protein n=1 Tax=Enterobacter sp. TaxID=42895 RepID=UPI00296E382A|nr:hypothetical protein [Enterobacter sp.]
MKHLKNAVWYHGTNGQKFPSWLFPTPARPNEPLLFQLTAVYLTTDLNFAKQAGSNIAEANVLNTRGVLDLVNDQQGAEKLRVQLNNRDLYKYSETTKAGNWRKGCKTGDCAIYTFTHPDIHQVIVKRAAELHRDVPQLTASQAMTVQLHNMKRAHIETMCIEAKKLGYSGMFFHEADNHTTPGTTIAQPVLAVFRNGVISQPIW